jgi:hypothetical protein
MIVAGVRVGDPVRIRDHVGRAGTCPEMTHDSAEHGHSGVVIGERPRLSFPSHAFLVVFDQPVPVLCIVGRWVPLHVRHYAADELEPLNAED